MLPMVQIVGKLGLGGEFIGKVIFLWFIRLSNSRH